MVLPFLKHVVSYFLTSDHSSPSSTKRSIGLAKQRVRNLLKQRGLSFTDICLLVEHADNKNDLRKAFQSFNRIIWTLKVAAPTDTSRVLLQALKDLNFSAKLGFYLNSVPNTDQAIMAYKTTIVQELSENKKRLEDFKRTDNSFQEHLFKTYFPETITQPSEINGAAKGEPTNLRISSLSFGGKRGISEKTKDRIPK